MKIVLYPRVARSNRALLVWIGVLQRQPPAPSLTWLLNGSNVQPKVLREIQSARTDEMLGADKNVARAFTGLYEFSQLGSGGALDPDTRYVVTVQSQDHEDVQLEMRTLPERVTSDFTDSFNVLLVSCFHRDTDPGGYAGILINDIKQRHQPDVTLLLGDQVYLDLPTLMNFEDNLVWMAQKFEDDYLNNWQGPEGYSRVLNSAPSACMPDDHEYWNNYPHRSYHLQNTHHDSGRKKWEKAARRMYEAFQLSMPENEMGRAMTFDVPPLSFFLADMRTYRDYDMKRVLGDASNPGGPNALKQLEDWVQHVIDQKMYGVFGSGQSLFAKQPRSLWGKVKQKVKGTVADHELFEYDDYGAIVRQLERLSDADRPLLCITGDVHYGRVLAAKDLRKSWRASIYEVISSPASLVMDVTSDWTKGAPTAAEPWPRHSEVPDPDPFYAPDALGQRFACELQSVLHRQRGNHVVLLSFRDYGGGLELKVKFWPIYPNSSFANPVDLQQPIYLSTLG